MRDVEYCNGAGGVGRRLYGIEKVRETNKGETKIILVISTVSYINIEFVLKTVHMCDVKVRMIFQACLYWCTYSYVNLSFHLYILSSFLTYNKYTTYNHYSMNLLNV